MKSSKLELFGFDDTDAVAEDDDCASGSSNYRIKYFGFDDLSESDSEEDEGSSERRKAKRKAAAFLEVPLMPTETSVDCPKPREIQSLQSSHTAGHSHGLKNGQYLLNNTISGDLALGSVYVAVPAWFAKKRHGINVWYHYLITLESKLGIEKNRNR